MSIKYSTPISQKLANLKVNNLLGLKFNTFLVVQFIGSNANGSATWICACVSCENIKHYTTGALRHKAPICKCQQIYKFGMPCNQSAEYQIYHNAKYRCNNPKAKHYANYGGRGIKFLFTSFDEFITTVGNRPSPKHSIERINNEGHYEPSNCKWATPFEQAQNRRNPDRKYKVMATANGQTKTLLEWAKELTVTLAALYLRKERGWCDYCTVNCPPYKVGCKHRFTS